MTRLEWDKANERLYETGLDRGVLYLPSSPGVYDDGVPWNGLVSVEEDFGGSETTPVYFDGIKYLDTYLPGDFAASLSAYTYPDEFSEFEGVGLLGYGLYADDQRPKVFSLSYRTLIGSGTQGDSAGYKIHLLYNLTATSDDLSYQTRSDDVNPLLFNWSIVARPEATPGFRPTAHVILDSRFLTKNVLETLEKILYGWGEERDPDVIDGLYPYTVAEDSLDGGGVADSGVDVIDGLPDLIVPDKPRLPDLSTLISVALSFQSLIISTQLIPGLALLVAGEGDLTFTQRPGFYFALPDTRLVETAVPGIYTLSDLPLV